MRKCKFFIVLITIFIAFLAACKSEEKGLEDKKNTANKGVKQMQPEELSDAFLHGEYEKIYGQMSKEFQNDISLKQLQGLGEEFNEGVSAYILQSELPYGNDGKQFVWTDDSGSKGMIAIFDGKHIIQGLQIMPLNKFPETDDIYTKTVFDIPFEGEWLVFWGGANSLINYHYEYDNQRYAFDFVIMDGNSTYDGDPALNESYYAFGKEYLAPADGTVVKVENNVKDNEPVGEMNEKQPLGNYVIINHGNEEYSYLAHFKYQSIEVKEGDKVNRGDLLGAVGNSGNSSEPHIHFHVADSEDPQTSKSIRLAFNREKTFIQGDIAE